MDNQQVSGNPPPQPPPAVSSVNQTSASQNSILSHFSMKMGIGIIMFLILIEAGVFSYFLFFKKTTQTATVNTASSVSSTASKTSSGTVSSTSNPVVTAIENTEKTSYVIVENAMLIRFTPGSEEEIENVVPLKIMTDSVYDNVSGNYKSAVKTEHIFNNADTVQYGTMELAYIRSEDKYFVNFDFANPGNWMVFDPKTSPNPPPDIASLSKTNYTQTMKDLKALYKVETMKTLGKQKILDTDTMVYEFDADPKALGEQFATAFGQQGKYSFDFSEEKPTIIFYLVEGKIVQVVIKAHTISVIKKETQKKIGGISVEPVTIFNFLTESKMQEYAIKKPSGTITSLEDYMKSLPTPSQQ